VVLHIHVNSTCLPYPKPGRAYTNSELTDSSSWMLLIASASNDATESTFSLAHRRSLPLSGIVLVTTTSSNLDAFKRSRACPERTGCVQADQPRRAPCSRQACAPWVIVPAVSIMSYSIRAS